MYLKKLELLGFKSFADRTQFIFQPGLTGIVGPNGCGKSNVVDAFKWIFGEQSAKGLRGSEMRDVIFNGTQSRKPTGFAEVSVTFDNADGFLPVDFAEVEIARRLFRSGESEYFINKDRCRLKDIRELFLDTGIGRTSYSILEQGKIDVLLQASTLDRRVIFEEAAGISKYRVKKAEALRALARAQENLNRLQDIIDEVEKRIRRVKIQAGRARKYREYSDRLRELRIRLALEEFVGSVEGRADISFGLHWCGVRLEHLEGLIGRLAAGLDCQTEARLRLASSLQALRERLASERIAKERTAERIRQAERRGSELLEERERKAKDLNETLESLEGLRRGVELERGKLATLAREIEGRRERLTVAVDDLKRMQESQERSRNELEACKNSVVELIQKRSKLANSVVQVTSELANLRARKDRLENTMRRLREELDVCERRSEEHRARLSETARQQTKLEDEKTAIEAAIVELEEGLRHLEATRSQRQEELHRKSSRYDALRSFEEELGGVAAGVAEVLRREGDLPRGACPAGMVATLLRVERKYAQAVEAALGARTQSLVIETEDGALELLEFVRNEKLGGVEVIPLDRLDYEPLEYFPRQAGVVGPLRAVVELQPQFDAGIFQDLVDRLLANILLVEDLDRAISLARNGSRPFRLVTLDGDLVEPWGGISVPGVTEPGILSRRSEMEELLREVDRLEEICRALQGDLRSLRQQLETRSEEARVKQVALEEKRRSRVAAEGELAQNEREMDRLRRELKISAAERTELDEEIRVRLEEKDAREKEVQAVELERAATEDDISNRQARLQALTRDLECLNEATGRLRLEVARSEKQEEGLRQLIERQATNLQDRERRCEDLREEISMLGRRSQDTEQSLQASRRQLEDLEEEVKSLEGQLRSVEDEDRFLAELETAFRQELDKVRARVQEVSREREGLQLRDQEDRLRRNTLLERIDEQYGIDLQAVLGRRAEQHAGTAGQIDGATDAEGESATTARETAGEPAGGDERFLEPPPDWNRDEAKQEAKLLQEKIRKLGNVNLEALEELEELEERHKFQIGQKNDLVESERKLRTVIGEINRKSREMFLESFQKVQEHFSDLFRKCFGGGKAELVLEEGVDVLEAGIDLVARPPGKKLTSLSLMSGGEKTMTTIALLLAIFRSRPSPFCILDEVDAALDDANVRRFAVLVRDFLQQSQFIVITHNKVTMAEAGTLYGVTMEERGVSRKVAVELEDYDPQKMEAAAVRTEA